jgi:hypothetical protein
LIVRPPTVLLMPVVLTLRLLLIVPEPTVPDRASVPVLLLLTVTAPPDVRTTFSATVFSAPIAPVPEFKFTVLPVTVLAPPVMVPAPVAVNVTELVPEAFAPREMLPEAAVERKVRFVEAETRPVVLTLPLAARSSAPFVALIPELLIELLFVTVPEPSVPDTANVPPGVNEALLIVFAPALLKTIASASVASAPTAPVPPLRVTVAPRNAPAVCEMVPALVAVRVTEAGPVTFPPRVIEPLPADVEVSPIVEAAVNAPVVMFWLEDKASEPVLPETVSMVPERVVFVIVVAPLFASTTALAVVFKPTAPVPALMLTVGACTCPAVWLMVPAFVAVSVIALPPVMPAASEMLPLPAEVELNAIVV